MAKQLSQLNLQKWQQEEKARVLNLVRGGRTISPFDSVHLLLDGFERFQARDAPSSLKGVSFTRIAGQAICLEDAGSKLEVLRILNAIMDGGAFVILGHGGIIPCGAVAAKKKALELAKEGKKLNEPDSVLELLERISGGVQGKGSPEAELENARFQAKKLLDDAEIRKIIDDKNLTVVVAVCSDCRDITYEVMNRTNGDGTPWSQDKLVNRHSKLVALQKQLKKGLTKAMESGIELKDHYAHGIFIYDPLDLRRVLDRGVSELEVGGICCVDARLKPNTPDGPKLLFAQLPNTTFDVTVDLDKSGVPTFSVGDVGSRDYADGHIAGIKVRLSGQVPDEEMGNGHKICLATSLDFATNIKDELLKFNNLNPDLVTVASFDGKALRIQNRSIGVDARVSYEPRIRICNTL